jgi:hypothetical protein
VKPATAPSSAILKQGNTKRRCKWLYEGRMDQGAFPVCQMHLPG